MADNVTIRDLAKMAEVSVSTASRALNNNPSISLKTRERLQKLAVQMGYQSNLAAKTLASGRSNTVGVIFPVAIGVETNNAFFVNLLNGINEQLRLQKWVTSIAMGETAATLMDNVKVMVEQGQVKRFIFLSTQMNEPILAYLQQRPDIRYVVIGQPHDAQTTLFVDNDNYLVGRGAIEYLLAEYPIKTLALVSSNREADFEMLRKRGIQDVATERKIKLIKLELELEGDEVLLNQFVEQYADSLEGIIGTDDDVAMMLLTKLMQAKKPILPTIGVNNTWYLKNIFGSSFKSVELHPKQLGAEAARLLLGQEKVKAVLVNFEI